MKRKCDSFSRPLSLPECDFALFDHSRITFPFGHTSSTYFQGLGSSPKPVKLLKVLDMGELARSRSTTELLPLKLSFYSTCALADNSLRLNLPQPANLRAHHQESTNLNYDEVLRILRRRNQTWLRRKLTA